MDFIYLCRFNIVLFLNIYIQFVVGIDRSNEDCIEMVGGAVDIILIFKKQAVHVSHTGNSNYDAPHA